MSVPRPFDALARRYAIRRGAAAEWGLSAPIVRDLIAEAEASAAFAGPSRDSLPWSLRDRPSDSGPVSQAFPCCRSPFPDARRESPAGLDGRPGSTMFKPAPGIEKPSDRTIGSIAAAIRHSPSRAAGRFTRTVTPTVTPDDGVILTRTFTRTFTRAFNRDSMGKRFLVEPG